MRYYLDTNVLIFLLLKDGNLDRNIETLIDDTSNILYVSSIATNEVLHLYKTGKINLLAVRSAKDIIKIIKDADIEIRPFTEYQWIKQIK
jgi:PIN domain nuclease of toxin-antitoxin system